MCGYKVIKNEPKDKAKDEHIKELEEASLNRREWYQKGYKEAMNKTCEGCKNLLQKLEYKRPFCVEHNYFLTHESKKVLFCNRFKPKDNA